MGDISGTYLTITHRLDIFTSWLWFWEMVVTCIELCMGITNYWSQTSRLCIQNTRLGLLLFPYPTSNRTLLLHTPCFSKCEANVATLHVFQLFARKNPKTLGTEPFPSLTNCRRYRSQRKVPPGFWPLFFLSFFGMDGSKLTASQHSSAQ